MSSRPSIVSCVAVAFLMLAGLAVAGEAGRQVERGAAAAAERARRINPAPTTIGPVYVRVGTGNVLSEFGPFVFATITDLGTGDGLELYVVEGSPMIAPDAPSVRFAGFDESARLWRFDYQGITGEGAFVSIAGFSVVSSSPATASRK